MSILNSWKSGHLLLTFSTQLFLLTGILTRMSKLLDIAYRMCKCLVSYEYMSNGIFNANEQTEPKPRISQNLANKGVMIFLHLWDGVCTCVSTCMCLHVCLQLFT